MESWSALLGRDWSQKQAVVPQPPAEKLDIIFHLLPSKRLLKNAMHVGASKCAQKYILISESTSAAFVFIESLWLGQKKNMKLGPKSAKFSRRSLKDRARFFSDFEILQDASSTKKWILFLHLDIYFPLYSSEQQESSFFSWGAPKPPLCLADGISYAQVRAGLWLRLCAHTEKNAGRPKRSYVMVVTAYAHRKKSHVAPRRLHILWL